MEPATAGALLRQAQQASLSQADLAARAASPLSQHSPGWSARLASSWRWACAGRLAACAGGERHDARLGRAVVGLADGAEQAGARGRVDDPPPTPRAPLSALRSSRAV